MLVKYGLGFLGPCSLLHSANLHLIFDCLSDGAWLPSLLLPERRRMIVARICLGTVISKAPFKLFGAIKSRKSLARFFEAPSPELISSFRSIKRLTITKGPNVKIRRSYELGSRWYTTQLPSTVSKRQISITSTRLGF